MKLFIAVPIDKKEDKEFCVSCLENVKASAISGRFAPPENFHVTLVFIGETDCVSGIKEVMGQVIPRHNRFQLSLTQIGQFFRRDGSIVWVGGESKELSELYSELSESLASTGFDVETRKYRAHVTLGRKVVFSPSNDKAEEAVWLRKAARSGEHTMDVRRIVLYSSERAGGKQVYREVYSVPLGK